MIKFWQIVMWSLRQWIHQHSKCITCLRITCFWVTQWIHHLPLNEVFNVGLKRKFNSLNHMLWYSWAWFDSWHCMCSGTEPRVAPENSRVWFSSALKQGMMSKRGEKHNLEYFLQKTASTYEVIDAFTRLASLLVCLCTDTASIII